MYVYNNNNLFYVNYNVINLRIKATTRTTRNDRY